MIAVDTNILIYAHRSENERYEAAYAVVRQLAENPAPWGIPWHSLVEFLGVVTHPKIFDPPTPLVVALSQVDKWLKSPSLHVLTEGPGAWGVLRDVLVASRVTGPRVHDARIAALCRLHGVSELWTADRDFRQFSGIRTRNPLS